jgi:uncharacterized protein YlaI
LVLGISFIKYTVLPRFTYDEIELSQLLWYISLKTMPYQAHKDPKPQYTCPQCSARVASESESCPKCGCIGPMQHLEIRLTGKNAAGKKIIVSPPVSQHDNNRRKSKGGIGTTSQYTCPKCHTKVNGASGECPNRACGTV